MGRPTVWFNHPEPFHLAVAALVMSVARPEAESARLVLVGLM